LAIVPARSIGPDRAERSLVALNDHCRSRFLLVLFSFSGAPAYLHGGGWVMGDIPAHERLCTEIVQGAGAFGMDH